MVTQSLFRREESAAVLAEELADFPVLRNLVSEPVVLSGESLLTALCALEGDFGLGLVGLHMHLQGVLAGESTVAAEDETGEPAPVSFLGFGPVGGELSRCGALGVVRRR